MLPTFLWELFAIMLIWLSVFIKSRGKCCPNFVGKFLQCFEFQFFLLRTGPNAAHFVSRTYCSRVELQCSVESRAKCCPFFSENFCICFYCVNLSFENRKIAMFLLKSRGTLPNFLWELFNGCFYCSLGLLTFLCTLPGVFWQTWPCCSCSKHHQIIVCDTCHPEGKSHAPRPYLCNFYFWH